METLNELALFAGAGGGILGGKLLGWRTVCAVEWDAYAASVLVARQNDGCLPPFPIWDDVQTFDGNPWRGRVDVISGGFPCQDISAAGKGAGIEGERSGMWKHMARIIGEILPAQVWVENSPMLVGRGLGTVLADLAEMGYDAEWGIVGAHHAAAPHKRDRIWIIGKLGNAYDDGQAATEKRGSTPQGSHASPPRKIEAGQSARSGEQLSYVANAQSARTRNDGENNGARSGEIHAPDDTGSTSGGDDRPEHREAMANASSAQDHAERGDCECGRNGMGRTEQATQQNHRATDHHSPCRCCGDVADTSGSGLQGSKQPGTLRNERDREKGYGSATKCSGSPGSSLRNAPSTGLPHRIERPMGKPGAEPESERSNWWATEPDVGRVAHRVAARVDRLRCIGNGQVPAVVKLAWETLRL